MKTVSDQKALCLGKTSGKLLSLVDPKANKFDAPCWVEEVEEVLSGLPIKKLELLLLLLDGPVERPEA